MLRLIDVCKGFKFGKEKTLVLDKINLDFKKNEMVFILGKSGSGKSTLLNIIGGLLEVDSGRVMLDDKNITKFSNKMLCNYRNNMIGFIFQDYHLIEYMSVIDNIKLGQTIHNNGNKIEDVLKKLGIYSKRKVIVNKLSGGEKQRVAIARAIINNPDIVLCDEPTGALDSENGIKIMDILKEISCDKLVIVVSHDKDLANKYADRIINIVDGKVEYYPQIDNGKFREIKNKKISLLSIIKLAIKNLCLKKGRTLFTSVAISIGFVCMLLVLCLSRGVNDDIDKLERDIVSVFPISVYNGEFEIVDNNLVSSNEKIIVKDRDDYIHTNKIISDYIDYINDIDEIEYVGYQYDISMPIISDRYKIVDNNYIKMIPSNDFINNNYDILYGKLPDNKYEILLKIDSNNNVDSDLISVLDISEDIEYSDLIGRELKVILNDLYYVKNGEYYFINNDNIELYNNSDIKLKVVGIVQEKEVIDNNSYFYFSKELFDYVIKMNSNSEIVLEQLKKEYSVLGIDMNKDKMLSYLGYDTLPNGIDIYVSNIDNKNIVLSKLDKYNDNNEKLVYVDTMKDAIDILKNFINIITIILLCFSFISIIVSSLMIFILTNNRVMERVKEIGILKSLGASNGDITKLFNIENLIISIISSFVGLIILFLLNKPINYLMGIILEDGVVFNIYSDLVIIMIIFNMIIVVLSGLIPSKIASKKNIASCLSGRC